MSPTSSTFDIPSSITFIQSAKTDIPSSIFFKQNFDIQSNILFKQFGEESITSSIVFKKKFDIPSSITFTYPNNFDIPSYIFLGSFKKDIPSSIRFINAVTKDFRAQIQIRQVNVQKTTLTNSAQTDIISSVYFNAKDTFDIPSNITFSQFGSVGFPATITIRNTMLGAGNITVTLQQATDDSSSTTSSYTALSVAPPIEPGAITVQTDSTGYFSINGLQPGTYTIIPQYGSLNFSPPAFDVTIINSNITLNFSSSGELVNAVATGSVVPIPTAGTCLIVPNSSGSGGFSIDGYINLEFDYDNYNEVITIITDEDIASQFRHIITAEAIIEE